ncbi:MAG: hypothetical protein QM739_05700 [Propionivibrio sp.]
MDTNITQVLLGYWNTFLKNFLIAVALGLLSGALLSAIDHTALDDRIQETPSTGRYLP